MAELSVTSPYDETEVGVIKLHTAHEADGMLEQAEKLAKDKNSRLPLFQRIEVLEKTIDLMHQRKESFIKTALSEGGKPYQDTKVEVDRAINGIKLAIEHAGQLNGQQIIMGQTPASVRRLAFTIREPIGVVLAISAFNHPLNLIVHQVIPAVITGCPVIVKPAMVTPLSCLAFLDILYEAGLPKVWAQVLLCDNTVAEKVSSDSRINYLTFIGSAKVGWHIRSKINKGCRIALEHGGAAPVIVAEDADMAPMVPLLVKGGFYHAGQVCVSVQRVFVHHKQVQSVAKDIAEQAKKLKVGDPKDEQTEVGPLISPTEVDRVASWVDDASEKSDVLLCGGQKLANNCYEPTVLLNPPSDALVSNSEIFGPVICVYSYEDQMEAIQRANALPYSFQAAVFTKDVDNMLRVVNQLDAATVMVNDHTAFRVDWMPFGGRNESGIGVGGIQYGMHEMTQEKLIVIKSNAL